MNKESNVIKPKFVYDRSLGKYGLLKKDLCIAKITMYSTTIYPQEIHFDYNLQDSIKYNKSSAWAYIDDFIAFGSRRKLKRIKRRLRKEQDL